MNSPIEDPGDRGRTATLKYSTWWLGWVWSIPLAAVGVVVWLTVRAVSARGVDVSVRFEEAAQMKPGTTRVFHRGIDVGTLTAVSLDRDGWHVRAVTRSPEIRDSLARLDRTIADLEKTLRAAGPEVAPTIQSIRATAEGLRNTAAQIDATTATARRAMGGTAAAPSGNLQQAVRELTDAARAIRTLADYLDEHPESLLRGR